MERRYRHKPTALRVRLARSPDDVVIVDHALDSDIDKERSQGDLVAEIKSMARHLTALASQPQPLFEITYITDPHCAACGGTGSEFVEVQYLPVWLCGGCAKKDWSRIAWEPVGGHSIGCWTWLGIRG